MSGGKPQMFLHPTLDHDFANCIKKKNKTRTAAKQITQPSSRNSTLITPSNSMLKNIGNGLSIQKKLQGQFVRAFCQTSVSDRVQVGAVFHHPRGMPSPLLPMERLHLRFWPTALVCRTTRVSSRCEAARAPITAAHGASASKPRFPILYCKSHHCSKKEAKSATLACLPSSRSWSI